MTAEVNKGKEQLSSIKCDVLSSVHSLDNPNLIYVYEVNIIYQSVLGISTFRNLRTTCC